MPYVDNKGVRTHYHTEGDGPPLVLHHGFSGTLKDWYDYGYVDGLKDDYHLILVDSRGHGGSDKPHDPRQYDLEERVGDIVAVLDALNVDKAHFFGYSMGGLMGFNIAKSAPERFHTLIIGGMHPYKMNMKAIEERAKVLQGGMEAHVANAEANGGPMPPERKARALANDVQALIAVLDQMLEYPGVPEIVPNMKMPCLLFAGEEDLEFYPGAEEGVKHMPNVTFVPIAGADHGGAFQRSEIVLPHVTRFLKASVPAVAT